MRRLTENYGFTPEQIGNLTLDQLWAYSVDEKELLAGARTMTGTPEQLRSAGVLEDDGDDVVSLADLLYPPLIGVSRAERKARRMKFVAAARAEE